MTDTMLFGVLKMPFEMAMSDEISRTQFYARVQELVGRFEAQQQAEPVSQAVIAGALFDFMGWLTTRKERLVLSSTDNASPAADAIKVFAEMRGLSLADARVQDWQNYTTQQQAEPPQRPWVGLTDDEILSTDPWEILRADPWMGTSDSNINPYQILLKVRTLEAKLKERNA